MTLKTKAQFRRRTSHVPYPNTFSLQGRIKRLTLRYPEILPCLIEFCQKKKTDLDTVPLPNNYILLGKAHV